MTYIQHYFLRMGAFVAAVLLCVLALKTQLISIFSNNIFLNSVISSCLILGIGLCFYQLYRLKQEQQWLDTFEQGTERFPNAPKAQILAPLAIIFSDPSHGGTLSAVTAKSILSSVEARLDESRHVTRYLVGLLIFLGLLGTFWGLSETIGAIAGVINGIDMGSGEVKDAFQNLKKGLQSPLSGMGTAFSCSMFGLASSLIVGFLDLQISGAGNKFYQTLEERLAMNTRLGSSVDHTGQSSGPAYSLGLLEQTVEALSNLQNQMRRTEDNRLSLVKTLHTLTERMTQLTEQMGSHQGIMKKIAQNQIDLQENVLQIGKAVSETQKDETLKHHLRNIDATAAKLLEESVEGRNRLTQELRNEIRVIARTLSAIANGQDIAA
jgi:biopolymer transport protein ExbB/TolQ